VSERTDEIERAAAPERAAETGCNIRSASYFIATIQAPCQQCAAPTRLLALALPADHELLDPEADPDLEADPDPGFDSDTGPQTAAEPGISTWQTEPLPAVLFDVYRVAPPVQRQLQRRSAGYRYAADGAAASGAAGCWGNHCEHCGALQDEAALHGEPDAGFMPMSPATAARIEVEAIAEPLLAGIAGYAVDPQFFPFPAGG
jgi:hypothetical protein